MLRFFYFIPLIILFYAGCASKNTPPNFIHQEEKKSITRWDSDFNSTINALYLQFVIHVQDQKMEEARKLADELILAPLSNSMYLDVASFFISEGEREKARHILEQALLLTPYDTSLLLLWTDVAKTQQEATKRLEQVLEKKNNDEALRIRLYTLYYTQKNYNTLLSFIKNHREESSIDAIDYFYSGLALHELKEEKKSIEAFKKAIQLKNNFPEAILELGAIYEKKEEYELAQKLYTEGIQQAPNIQELWMRLVSLYVMLNEPNQALEYVKQGPQTKTFLFASLGLFLENEFFDDALNILDIIKEQYSNVEEIHFYNAYIYYERDNNYKKAIEELNKISQKNPFYVSAIEFIANIYQMQKRNAEAVLIIDTARRKLPNNKKLWDLQAKALIAMQEYDKAIEVYTQALKQWPNELVFHFNIGNVYIFKKDTQKAIEAMEKILSLNNDYIPALTTLSNLLLQEQYNIPQAKILLEKAYFIDSNNISVLYNLSRLYALEGQYKKAWSLIQKAKTIGIETPTMWEYYGDVAAKVENKSEAALGYKKALEYDPKNTVLQKKLQNL